MEYPLTIATVGRADFILAANLKLVSKTEQETRPFDFYTSYSGLKLNFANSKKNSGADGNIELYKLDDVLMRTQACMQLITQAVPESTKGANPLQTVLGFVPNTYGSMQGQPAIDIARKLDFQRTTELASAMINSGGKYAARNKANGEILQLAAYIAEVERQNLMDIFKDQTKALSYVQSIAGDPNYNFWNYIYGLSCEHPEYFNFSDESVSKETGLIVYEAKMKTPHIQKVVNGRTKVYSLSITCNPKDPMPFTVSISTGTGIPVQGKSIGIQQGSYQKGEDFTVKLASYEWVNIISTAVKLRDAYTASKTTQAVNLALQWDAYNKQSAMQPAS